ncbi:ATP-binding cassette domain-containing protein, partial [Polymorphobacter multimanifer]
VAAAAALGGASAPLAALAALAAAGGAEVQGAFIRARGKDAALAAARDRLTGLGADTVLPAPAPVGEALTIAGHQLLPGGRLALTGASGSGKTRILESLAGWRADAPQSLQLGGVPVAEIAFATLGARFACAPQSPVLIAGSVADNLRLAAPGLDDAALWDALETACLADDVRALTGGLDHWLGEGAGQFSGGQRKRLSLARALLARRPWLLLDEPTEGLDATSEAELVRRLGMWLDATGTGLILTSHRPAPLALTGQRIHL